jgi:outer membrane protein, heavy metal efflux system
MTLCVAGVVLGAGGCASYEASPLDVEGTREAWLNRLPKGEDAGEYAKRLAEQEGRATEGAFDVADGLTLAEGEAVALVFNPELRVARLKINVARATAENVGLWEDPTLAVDLERILKSVDNPWIVGATVDITIPISGRLEVEKARAGKALASQVQRVAAQEWATRAAVRELWLGWSAQKEQLALEQELVKRLEDVGTLARKQEEAGSMSRIETRLFDVELEGVRAELIAREARVAEMEIELKFLLGLAPGAPVRLVPTVTYAGQGKGVSEDLKEMETRNQELAAVRAEYEVAEESLRLEVRKQYPDLTIGPGYKNEDGGSRVLFNVAMPLPLWNQNKLGVAEAGAQRDVAKGEFTAMYERLGAKLAMAQTRYEAGHKVRVAVEEKVVPLADEQEAKVREVAGLGRVDPLLILQAIKTQHEAKVRLVEAREAESLGAVRVAELVGPVKAVAAAETQNAVEPGGK